MRRFLTFVKRQFCGIPRIGRYTSRRHQRSPPEAGRDQIAVRWPIRNTHPSRNFPITTFRSHEISSMSEDANEPTCLDKHRAFA
jgi:hypothetical protein